MTSANPAIHFVHPILRQETFTRKYPRLYLSCFHFCLEDAATRWVRAVKGSREESGDMVSNQPLYCRAHLNKKGSCK